MVTFADPVDGVPFTDPDGLDDWAKWDRVLTAAELAVLPARLDA